jgi:transposase
MVCGCSDMAAIVVLCWHVTSSILLIMTPPATKEIRELVMYQTTQLGWDTGQVAKALQLSTRTVQRIKKLHNEIGATVLDPSDDVGRPKAMSPTHIKAFSFLSPFIFCS